MPRGNVPGWGLPTVLHQGTPSTQLPSLGTRLVKGARLVRGVHWLPRPLVTQGINEYLWLIFADVNEVLILEQY